MYAISSDNRNLKYFQYAHDTEKLIPLLVTVVHRCSMITDNYGIETLIAFVLPSTDSIGVTDDAGTVDSTDIM
jgi:hypothetical protein